ncbi:MAG: MFS transporter [Porticoccaceae bacterium]|nr:MAG: MFS transporter [Porticoccaceae bacterium]
MRPDEGMAWRQVAIATGQLAATAMIATTWSLWSLPLATELAIGRGWAMLPMTVVAGMSALFAPLLGALLDRLPLRPAMAAGGLALAAGYLWVSRATSLPEVLLAFALLVAPANVLLGPVAAVVLLTRWFERRRGRALGLALTGISLGTFAFPLLVQGLLNIFPWRDAMALTAAALLSWTVPLALAVREPSRAPRPAAGGARGGSARRILLDPAFWLLAATVAVVTSGMKGMVTNLALLAVDGGVPATLAGTLVSLYAVAGLAAKLAFAALADRTGPRPLMAVALAGFAAGMAWLGVAQGYPALALGVMAVGLFGGLMLPMESWLAPRIFGAESVGRAMGLLSGAILVALLATPPLFGAVADATGSYRAALWTAAALAAVALTWLPTLRLAPRPS